MKLLFVVTAVLSFSPCLIAGAFFTNTILKKIPAESIQKFLKREGYASFVVMDTAGSEYTLVSAAVLDEGPSEFEKFLTELTIEFKTSTIACFVADSDALYLCAFEHGKKVFEYNSRPDWGWDPAFGPMPSDEPQITGLDHLIAIYPCDEKEFLEFTKKSKVESYVFAEELQVDIYKMLSIPSWVIGIGYTYLKQDDTLVNELRKSGKKVLEVQ